MGCEQKKESIADSFFLLIRNNWKWSGIYPSLTDRTREEKKHDENPSRNKKWKSTSWESIEHSRHDRSEYLSDRLDRSVVSHDFPDLLPCPMHEE